MRSDVPRPARMPARPPAAARWLAALIAVVVVGCGLLAMTSGHYHGRTSKLGGAVVTLDGAPAMLFGAGLALLGLSPLALWARSARAAGWWMGLASTAGVALMLGSAWVR